MNAFAEDPFFFFVDNLPPISPINASKNTRRIVELSDTGCDARLSVSTLLRNATRFYSAESAKMRSKEYWKPRAEKKYTNVPLEERFRRPYERDAIDAEELYFMPKETENQNYWQDYPAYDINENVEHGRNTRIATERIPPRSQEYNVRYDRVPQRITNIPRNNSPFQPPFPKSKITTNRPQLPRFNYPGASEIYDQELYCERGRRRLPVDQDYSESFEEPGRNLRSHREHWQRTNEDLFDEIARQNHPSSRYDSRRMTSAKTSDRNESIGDKIRREARTPSSDRRKRTQSISKTIYQNAESQYDIQASHDSDNSRKNDGIFSKNRSSEKLKRFVDRAVDKDSLSDILRSPSKERLPKMAAERPVPKETRSSFWEFISLDDDDDKKNEKTSEKQKPPWPMRTKRQTENDDVKTKTSKKNVQKSSVSNTVEDATEMKSNKGVPSDDHTKLNAEEVDVASKKVDSKVAMNFMEKTVACLKRKIEKARVEEASNDVGQSCTIMNEKKIRSEGTAYSRLPIRIGRRLKSKNPISTRIRSNAEGCVGSKEENKDTGIRQHSVRSRTKPKAKSSFLENADIAGNIEAAEYSKSLGNVQQFAEVNSYEHNGYVGENQKGDEKMTRKSVTDKAMDYADEKLVKEENLGGIGNRKPSGSSKPLNLTGYQRKNEIGIPRGKKLIRENSLSKRIDISKNCLKDNCILRLHDEENIVCNGYCTKDCKKLNCLQSRIPTAIKSRL